MNETLRSNFYKSAKQGWSLEKCERYSIFLSQGNYPIKGLHYLLKAMGSILKEYPKTVVYVAGDIITGFKTLKEKLKLSSYGKYLRDLIKENGLENSVKFLGRMDSFAMCEQYLKSHVFLSPSAIENSPNSVGEAMLLGVPVVSSRVGGVESMLTHEVEGLLYQRNDENALADSIKRVFSDDDMAKRLSEAAKERAKGTHNSGANYRRLLEIYREIADS